jgi:hypothetical protein
VALVLVVLLQQFYLNRAQVRLEMYRAELAEARAAAAMHRRLAEQQLAAAQKMHANEVNSLEEQMQLIDKAKRAIDDPATKAMLEATQERAKGLIDEAKQAQADKEQ